MLKNKIYNPTSLTVFLLAALTLPVAILTYTEHNPFWMAVSALLLPVGFYTVFAGLSSRSGRMVWWSFPFIFFSAFQIVLSYLFGNSVVAADMFLNITTTNTGEASELLSNIYPSVIFIFALYLPLLWLGYEHQRRSTRARPRCSRPDARRRSTPSGRRTPTRSCSTRTAATAARR